MRRLILSSLLALWAAGLLAQGTQPAAPDIAALGPQVGSTAPGFSGVDQLGRTQTLQSSLGPKGAMLVFFRSADW